jgi:hypothetical protein
MANGVRFNDCISIGDWKRYQQRRKFFDNFANSKQFDPLVAENWYSVSHKDIVDAVCEILSLITRILMRNNNS